MIRFPVKKRTRPKIHLTALIDIVFLLLIFFLVTSNFVEEEGVTIIVPEVDSKNAELFSDIVVKIDQNGTLYFKGVVADDRFLLNDMRDHFEATSKGTVIIKADRRVQYDRVVQVIDIAKLAGAKNLLLVTERK
jgi:biopolymer transport protein ExbD